MPLYEYQCDGCGRRFEVIQKFADAPLETCGECSGTVRRLLSAPAIQFKGSGWYITDYARKGQGEGDKAGTSSAASGTSSADGAKDKSAAADAAPAKTAPSSTNSAAGSSSATGGSAKKA